MITVPFTQSSAQSVSQSVAVTGSRQVWEGVTEYITRAAEQLPQEKYGYKPTDNVRTFGELIGHIAGAQNLICAAALGEPQRAEDEIEKSVSTKAGLVGALKASTNYCRRAYSQSDTEAAGETTLFGSAHTRIYALTMNAVHNGEHYGNIVTYLRLLGMVPPSSQRTPPPG